MIIRSNSLDNLNKEIQKWLGNGKVITSIVIQESKYKLESHTATIEFQEIDNN